MKYLILDSLIKFFDENGFIEFNNVFSSNDLEMLNLEIDKLNLFRHPSFIENFKNSRDLFRKSNNFKKIILNNKIISIIKSLSKEVQFRLALDQVMFTKDKNPFDEKVEVNDFFSLQGLFLIFIVRLDESILDPNLSINEVKEEDILPKKRGSIMFLKNTSFLNFKSMFEKPQKFLIVGFSNFNTLYKIAKKDPNPNFLKTLGYNFGDSLKNSTHPIVN